MTTLRRKRTRYAEQRTRAQELLNAEDPPMAASAIARVLEREFGSGPTDRQVRNWINEGQIVVEPESAPWTVAHAEQPEDIPFVVDVIRAFPHPTLWITVAQARWVIRLRRAYPEMDAVQALDLARHALREDAQAFTKRLCRATETPSHRPRPS